MALKKTASFESTHGDVTIAFNGNCPSEVQLSMPLAPIKGGTTIAFVDFMDLHYSCCELVEALKEAEYDRLVE